MLDIFTDAYAAVWMSTYRPVLRWSVKGDPAVGEPFLCNWKADF